MPLFSDKFWGVKWRIDRLKQTFSVFEFSGEGGMFDSATSIRDIVEDEQQILWLGTDVGLYRFDQGRNTLQHYRHKTSRVSSAYI